MKQTIILILALFGIGTVLMLLNSTAEVAASPAAILVEPSPTPTTMPKVNWPLPKNEVSTKDQQVIKLSTWYDDRGNSVAFRRMVACSRSARC